MFPSLYDQQTLDEMLARIDQLTPESQPLWGKMSVAQMLAHNNVAFDITYGSTPVSYNFLMRWMLKRFVKPIVVGDKPYEKNGRTAPVFIVADERDFAKEKAELIANFNRFHNDGAAAFEGKESASFGKMTSQEWSNQFWKHMDHHLRQFGV
ncbi:DUF1569 domain-containing protein [Neolewinella aurantiaca]|uniref:DUF1569 domain-containing protein n=1 Tax=Neolewinella aurantiaca TaxID=2602767 RepID=A0A5C7FLA2_9BACT|nr:DUF1569 domain-containing protein [Neolewinella aurantiaca]TXF87124.1 DUF1569 domain-containing protein [Neolewinella aurantiaca]